MDAFTIRFQPWRVCIPLARWTLPPGEAEGL